MKVIYFQVRQKYVYKSLIYIDLRTRFHNQTLILHYTSPLEFNTTSAAPNYLAKTEHSHPLGMVVSTHFRCGKGVKRGLKNGALPFNID